MNGTWTEKRKSAQNASEIHCSLKVRVDKGVEVEPNFMGNKRKKTKADVKSAVKRHATVAMIPVVRTSARALERRFGEKCND